jgi:type III secretion system YscI/HrpB-like protein
MPTIGIGTSLVETASQAGTSLLPSAGNTPIFPAEKVTALDGALSDARARAELVRAAAAAGPERAVDATGSIGGTDQRRETIKALELAPDSAPRAVNPGDTILSGLKKLQGEFSDRQSLLIRDIDAPSTSTSALLKLQMDMVQYTLMIDVASKITGKMTQAVDSLTKGQ